MPGRLIKDEEIRQQLFAILQKAENDRQEALVAAETWLASQASRVEAQGLEAYEGGRGQVYVGRQYLLDGERGALHFQVRLSEGKLGPYWNPHADLAQEERSSLLFFFMVALTSISVSTPNPSLFSASVTFPIASSKPQPTSICCQIRTTRSHQGYAEIWRPCQLER